MEIKSIDVQNMKVLLEQNQAVLIDVREAAEHQAKNIPGAKSIPLGSLSENTLPDFKGKKLVLHCGGGGRAGRACEKLLNENPDLDVYNLKGGLRSWSAAGFQVNENGADSSTGNFCLTKK